MFDENQKEVIESINSPLVVVRGIEGSGKTSSLLEKLRVAKEKAKNVIYLVDNQISLDSLKQNSGEKENLFYSLDGFAYKILKEFGEEVDEIKVLENDLKFLVLRDLIEKNGISSQKFQYREFEVTKYFYQIIKDFKENFIHPSDVESLDFSDIRVKYDVLNIYVKYEDYLNKFNLVDKERLFEKAIEILENDSFKDKFKEKFDNIILDLDDDVSKLEEKFISLFSSNLTVSLPEGKEMLNCFEEKSKSDLKIIDLKNYYLATQRKIADEFRREYIDEDKSEEEKFEKNIYRVLNQQMQGYKVLELIESFLQKKPGSSIGIVSSREESLSKVSSILSSKNIWHEYLSGEKIKNDYYVDELIEALKVISDPLNSNSEIFNMLIRSSVSSSSAKKISRAASKEEKKIYLVLKKVIEQKDNISFLDGERKIVSRIAYKISHLNSLVKEGERPENIVYETIRAFNIYTRATFSEKKDTIRRLNYILNFVERYFSVYRNVCEVDISTLAGDLEKIREWEFGKQGGINSGEYIIELSNYSNFSKKSYDYILVLDFCDGEIPNSYGQSMLENPFDISREKFVKREALKFLSILRHFREDIEFISPYFMEGNEIEKNVSKFASIFDERCVIKEKDNLDNTLQERVKMHALENVKSWLNSGEYGKAKEEIDKLEEALSNKSLNVFIDSSRSSSYKRMLDEGKDKYSLEKIYPSYHVYSVSQLDSYEKCPRKYLFQYVYKIPPIHRHYFDFGTILHQILEEYADRVDKDDPSMLYGTLVNRLEELWLPYSYTSDQQELEYYQKALDSLRTFIERESYLKCQESREVISREREFKVDFHGRKIYGIIDRIDRTEKGIEVIDYKTSNKMESEIGLKSNLQLLIYYLAVKKELGEEPYKVGLWYLIHDNLVMVEIDNESLKKLENRVKNLMENVEKGNFEAKPSKFNCLFCDFNTICPFRKD